MLCSYIWLFQWTPTPAISTLSGLLTVKCSRCLEAAVKACVRLLLSHLTLSDVAMKEVECRGSSWQSRANTPELRGLQENPSITSVLTPILPSELVHPCFPEMTPYQLLLSKLLFAVGVYGLSSASWPLCLPLHHAPLGSESDDPVENFLCFSWESVLPTRIGCQIQESFPGHSFAYCSGSLNACWEIDR